MSRSSNDPARVRKVAWPYAGSAALLGAVSRALVSGRIFGAVAALVIVCALGVCLAFAILQTRRH